MEDFYYIVPMFLMFCLIMFLHSELKLTKTELLKYAAKNTVLNSENKKIRNRLRKQTTEVKGKK